MLILQIKQRATAAIATTDFPQAGTGDIGLARPAAGLVSGDRGCLPAVAAAANAAAQSATVQLTLPLGSTVVAATAFNVAHDYAAVTLLLCSTKGTCCTTNLCNTNAMSRVEMSFGAMIMAMTLALFGVSNGF